MGLTRPRYSTIYDTDYKASVLAATTGDVGNLKLGNTQPNSIDGVSLTKNSRILVKDQSDPTQNGIYVVANVGTGSNGWWTRAPDASENSYVTAGMNTIIGSGTTNGGVQFRLVTPDPIYLGNTALTFINPNLGSAAGANTYVQFNDQNFMSASAGFTFNKFTNAVSIGGTVNASGNLLAAAISGANLNLTGNLLASDIIGSSLNVSGNILASAASVSSLAAAGAISGASLNVSGNVLASAIIGSSLNVSGNVLASNIIGSSLNVLGNILSSGFVSGPGSTTILGNILPGANLTYDLGSPSQRWRTGYFSANTLDLGGSQISVTDEGFAFTSKGVTQTVSANGRVTANTLIADQTQITGNLLVGNAYVTNSISDLVYFDLANTYIGFGKINPTYPFDFELPTGGEMLHLENTVGTQAWFGAENYGGLAYQAGVEQNYVFSGSKTRPDHYVLLTNGEPRANIHGSTGNVIFYQSLTVSNNINSTYSIASYLKADNFNCATGSTINVNNNLLLDTGINLELQAGDISGVSALTTTDLVVDTSLIYTNSVDNQVGIGTAGPIANVLLTVNGPTHIEGNLVVTGNLTIAGNITTIEQTTLSIDDSIIYLSANNASDITDIGFVGHFINPGYQHTGFVRDATDGVWKLFANVLPEPGLTVDFTHAIYSPLRTGNLTAANVITTGIYTDNYFYANGVALSFYSNIQAASYLVTNQYAVIANITTANTGMKGYVDSQIASAQYTDAKVAAYLPNNTADVQAGNLTVTSLTANRIPFTSTNGLIRTSANLIYQNNGIRVAGTLGELLALEGGDSGVVAAELLISRTATNDTQGSGPAIRFQDNGNINNIRYFQVGGGNWQFIAYRNNWVEDMRLDSGGNLKIFANTVSTSTSSGALQVSGGVGIVGNVNAGNVSATTGTFSAINSTGFINTSGNVSAAVHTGGQVSVTGLINTTGNVLAAVHSGGQVSVTGLINTAGNVLATSGVFNALTVNGTTTHNGNTFLNNSGPGFTIFGPANLDPVGGAANLALYNSGGRTIMGWNYSGGRGEFDIICDRDGGSPGGLRIYDWNTANVRLANVLMDINYSQGMTVYGNVVPSASNVYSLGNTTNWWSRVWSVAVNALYADLAETYSSDRDYVPGTVLVFGGEREVTISTESHDPRVAGVVSTNPAYHMNAAADGVAVALQGRVPTKVQGPVAKGDRLVTSSIQGAAERLDLAKYQPGCIIGKSLEDIIDDSIQTIEVAVGRL